MNSFRCNLHRRLRTHCSGRRGKTESFSDERLLPIKNEQLLVLISWSSWYRTAERLPKEPAQVGRVCRLLGTCLIKQNAEFDTSNMSIANINELLTQQKTDIEGSTQAASGSKTLLENQNYQWANRTEPRASIEQQICRCQELDWKAKPKFFFPLLKRQSLKDLGARLNALTIGPAKLSTNCRRRASESGYGQHDLW